jgi:hypothetical protein
MVFKTSQVLLLSAIELSRHPIDTHNLRNEKDLR